MKHFFAVTEEVFAALKAAFARGDLDREAVQTVYALLPVVFSSLEFHFSLSEEVEAVAEEPKKKTKKAKEAPEAVTVPEEVPAPEGDFVSPFDAEVE